MADRPAGDRAEDLLRTAELLDQARRGDDQARSELLERYRGPLERFVHGRLPRSARSLQESQDAVQEVFVRVLKALDRFEDRGIGSFWGYLRTIANNYLKAQYRKDLRKAAQVDLPVTASQLADEKGSLPQDAVLRTEELELYERAVASIPSPQKEAFLLRAELGLDFRTIAADCGYNTPGAARVAVRRVATRIAARIGRGAKT